MGPLARTAGLPWGARILLLALAFAFAPVGHATALAGRLSAETGLIADTDAEHDRNCQCGDRCRKRSCCCAPKARRPKPPATPSRSDAPQAGPKPEADGGPPCWANAPCGDPAEPTATTVVLSSKALIAGRSTATSVAPVHEDCPMPDSTGRPCRRSSRLDRPPDLCR